MSEYEVAELTWENGQLTMQGLSGPGRGGDNNDTLESIVHQAACNFQQKKPNSLRYDQIPANDNIINYMGEVLLPGNQAENWSGSDQSRGGNYGICVQEECLDVRASASVSTTFFRDSDAAIRTRDSFQSSPQSFKTKTTYEGSACHAGSSAWNYVAVNKEIEHEKRDELQHIKGKGKMSPCSHSTQRSRSASIHNQSEQKRRDKINQKLKALQKLVPNASKTDKASMLDEVINYLKQLQAQLQMMTAIRNMPHMMVPVGTQQHMQMSLMPRMGMGMGGIGIGMGIGMLGMSSMAQPPASQSTPPVLHQAAAASLMPLHDPYNTFLAQSMNMDLYNKMAALQQQQMSQTMKEKSNPSQLKHGQGD